MKISEIKNNHDLELAWGVELDEEVFDPPSNLKKIGLLWEGQGPAEISDRLIDTIIAFTLSGAEVIVEVQPSDDVDHEYLLTLAGNAGFSVAAVPPTDPEEIAGWNIHCCAFSQSFLRVPNFSGHLYPITGYITYLVMEFFGGAQAAVPDDIYTSERFYQAVSPEVSDQAKAHMRKTMSDELGGEDCLKEYLGAILKAIQEEAKKQFLEDMTSYQKT